MNELLNKKNELLKEREKMMSSLDTINNSLKKIDDKIFVSDIVGKYFETTHGSYVFVKGYDADTNRMKVLEIKSSVNNNDETVSPQYYAATVIDNLEGYYRDFNECFKEITKEIFIEKLNNIILTIKNFYSELK